MNDINVLVVTGRVTRDAEMRYAQNGTAILAFGVAVNDSYLDKQTNEWKERANYVDCVVFGEHATRIQHRVTKGTSVTIHGHIRYSQWERDGQKRSKIECVVDHMVMHKTRQTGTATQAQQQPTYSAPPQVPAPEVYDEDIPF